MTIARWCGVAANALAFVAWVALWFGLCCNCSKSKSFCGASSVSAILCAVLSGLMFMAFRSYDCYDDELGEELQCSLSLGSFLNVGAIVVFVVSGVMMCFASVDGGGGGDDDDDV